MSDEGYYILIEGIQYPLPEEVYDLMEMVSLERDTYKEYLEGKISEEDLMVMYPDLKLKAIQLNFNKN
ncbi:hypothetical protein COY27_04740 [Candidatus Woesearchaeota archaeon CG_4_10_14_0_2_um_filter_33_13]|nr:MAG: hypothetical protein COY27_04740 [Candidatus Woesearchaeota archaeon CG_4_10_14_0_2_um_filter_33_13]